MEAIRIILGLIIILLQFIIITIIILAVMFLIVFLLYCVSKYATEKLRKEGMSKIDFQKDKDYYRDILKEYSAIELSYIDDFKIKEEKDIISTLLNLKLKRKIDITDDKIIILDKDKKDLKKTERLIFESIKEGKVIIKDKDDILLTAKNEAILDKLIEPNDYKEGQIKIDFIKLFLPPMSLTLCLFLPVSKLELIPLIIFGLPIYYLIAVMYFVTYAKEKSFSYVRTEMGEEVNKKLEGLKQYIKDYSLLHEKDKDDLVLWEEYLIYSVMFNSQSKKITEQISKLIEINK